ncbi:MAG: ATP phosphoribosyltransferase [Myxococcota bacterium]
MADGLTFALPKGRILRNALALLTRAGLDLGGVDPGGDRRLQLDLPGGSRVMLVKPTDVPTYVEHGVADIGIAGRDTLEEQGRDLYEPIDLEIGGCRLVVAEPTDRPAGIKRGMELRVATKYPNLARRHYARRGISPEIIMLYGSVELAPITGLADQIVDLVESGETLRQNRLVEVETIMEVTSRLIVHPATLKLRPQPVARLVESLRQVVAENRTSPGKVAAAQ